MRAGLEYFLRLLDLTDPAHVDRADLTGPHEGALGLMQEQGFIDQFPCPNPAPSCPHCLAGTPYAVDGRILCPHCRSLVEREDLLLWTVEIDAFLVWVARSLGCDGTAERIDACLWRLGAIRDGAEASECFFVRGTRFSELALRRLGAFRSVLLLHGKSESPVVTGVDARTLSLLDVIDVEGGGLRCRPIASLLRRGGRVRFDVESGGLYAGDLPLGRVEAGTREYHLIERLAEDQGRIVPYEDLKRHVCRRSGSRDATEEATFCQKLKARVKGRYRVMHVDRLIESDARGGGYRLVAELRLADE